MDLKVECFSWFIKSAVCQEYLMDYRLTECRHQVDCCGPNKSWYLEKGSPVIRYPPIPELFSRKKMDEKIATWSAKKHV